MSGLEDRRERQELPPQQQRETAPESAGSHEHLELAATLAAAVLRGPEALLMGGADGIEALSATAGNSALAAAMRGGPAFMGAAMPRMEPGDSPNPVRTAPPPMMEPLLPETGSRPNRAGDIAPHMGLWEDGI